MKSPKEIRNELLSAFMTLESSYTNLTNDNEKLNYIELNLCEFLLNSINDTMIHYSKDVLSMDKKKNWNNEMIRCKKLLEKYSEFKDSNLILKREFDSSGYLEESDFLKDL